MKGLLLLGIFFPSLALASPITFGFTGSILSGVANSFFGSYTFDSAVTPVVTEDFTQYVSSGGPYGMTIHYAGLTLSWSGVEILINNDEITGESTANPPISDLYFVHGLNGPNTFLNLRDCDGEALSSTALPLTPPDLSLFRPNCSIGDEVIIQGPGLSISRLAS